MRPVSNPKQDMFNPSANPKFEKKSVNKYFNLCTEIEHMDRQAGGRTHRWPTENMISHTKVCRDMKGSFHSVPQIIQFTGVISILRNGTEKK